MTARMSSTIWRGANHRTGLSTIGIPESALKRSVLGLLLQQVYRLPSIIVLSAARKLQSRHPLQIVLLIVIIVFNVHIFPPNKPVFLTAGGDKYLLQSMMPCTNSLYLRCRRVVTEHLVCKMTSMSCAERQPIIVHLRPERMTLVSPMWPLIVSIIKSSFCCSPIGGDLCMIRAKSLYFSPCDN